MQFFQTQAIVLHKTPIKDFKYILKLYSGEYGLISVDIEVNQYIQPAHIQVPNICDVQFTQNKYKKNSIKDIKPIYVYKDLLYNYKKNIIAQVITEIIIKSVKEEFSDRKIFQLIYQSLIDLDNADNNTLSSFHLFFIKKYIQISGHLPLNNYTTNTPFFHLLEGRFCNYTDNHTLSKEDSLHFFNFFFDENFELTPTFPVWRITEQLMNYLKYHADIKEIRSVTFLKDALLLLEL